MDRRITASCKGQLMRREWRVSVIDHFGRKAVAAIADLDHH